MDSSDEKLINIVLVGQPELNEILRELQCLPLLQRIGVRYQLQPLDLDETRNYVATRLRIAGTSSETPRPQGGAS
jgi:general secretion pathway protein A